ncbi:transposase [Lacrimispora celerecrescens]|uniref:transposase n=1 Tax=Lacrimispora celerecrescens TaxID=29354 RepID=UPI0038CD6D20
MKEDRESWKNLLIELKSRGLKGVRLIVGDKYLGMLELFPHVFPYTKYQRCTVHFYRNIFSVTSRSRIKYIAKCKSNPFPGK